MSYNQKIGVVNFVEGGEIKIGNCCGMPGHHRKDCKMKKYHNDNSKAKRTYDFKGFGNAINERSKRFVSEKSKSRNTYFHRKRFDKGEKHQEKKNTAGNVNSKVNGFMENESDESIECFTCHQRGDHTSGDCPNGDCSIQMKNNNYKQYVANNADRKSVV